MISEEVKGKTEKKKKVIKLFISIYIDQALNEN